jgi:hypothetical protein
MKAAGYLQLAGYFRTAECKELVAVSSHDSKVPPHEDAWLALALRTVPLVCSTLLLGRM